MKVIFFKYLFFISNLTTKAVRESKRFCSPLPQVSNRDWGSRNAFVLKNKTM